MVSALAGIAAGAGALSAQERDCRLWIPDGWEGVVEGRSVSRFAPGRTTPFRPEAGLPGGCRRTVRLLIPGTGPSPSAGERIRVRVRWEARGHPPGGRAEWAGRLRVLSQFETTAGGGPQGRLLGLRGAIQEGIVELWGERAPMVEALVLARREHLDPELREAFALSGTAHLLAISGFHVGVVAGLLLGLLRWSGLGPRRAATGAAVGSWGYVLGIGSPDAAVRAALLLTLLVASRVRGHPVVPVGALSSALLILLLVDPALLGSVGFQLSFAGTGGIILLRRPLGDLVDRGWRVWRGRPLVRGRKSRGPGEGLLRGSADGLVAGTAATLPTLPLLAWHFDRISLVGIPATLAIAPVVAAAIPGVGASLVLSLVPVDGPDRFLAGGVGVLLAAVEVGVVWSAEQPGASIWVSRPALLGGGTAGMLWLFALRWIRPGRIRAPARWGSAGGVVLIVLLLLPLFPGPRVLELHLLDVGQGDGAALRLPSGRWLVVDAGPRSDYFDAGARRMVPYLRRHGVRTVEALVLSHPHLDHVGGAPAVLQELRVRGVMDPSRPVPSAIWRETLDVARREGVSWWSVRTGEVLTADGVSVHVLHPDPATAADPDLSDWNDLSLVLLVRYGKGSLLLTGDAYHWIEEDILSDLPRDLSVLKVGHHGSRTSTGAPLLDHARPEVAVIPVGEGNRYGHPHGEVMQRLEDRGIRSYRTDRDGDLRVRIHADGSVEVRGNR